MAYRPYCSFNLLEESEQMKCFHYKNLQPLWGQDNLIKGGFIYLGVNVLAVPLLLWR